MTKNLLAAAIAMSALLAAASPAQAGTAVGNPGDAPSASFLALQEQLQQESRKYLTARP